MKVLETILSFLTLLARIIFPRKEKPAANATPCPCPNPLPAPAVPPLSPDAGDGGDDDLHRSDTLPLHQGSWGRTSLQGSPGGMSAQPLNLAGCCLMLTGAAGCVYKWFVA